MVFCATLLATSFVGGAVYAATTISTDISTGGLLSVAGLSSLNGAASTTQLTATGKIYVGSASLTTIQGDAATSTFTGGVNLTGGCFAIGGVCVASTATSAVSSVTAANGSLTITPTTGNVTAALNLGNSNAWTAAQIFAGASTTFTNGLVLGAGSSIDTTSGTLLIGTSSASAITIGRSAIVTTLPGPLTAKFLTTSSSVASSSFANGIDLTAGCFSIAGTCLSATGPSSAAGGSGAIQFANGTAFAGDNTRLTWDNTNFRLGIGTSSPYTRLAVVGEIVASYFTGTSTASSTLGGGMNITSGCFAILSVCLTNGSSTGASTNTVNTFTLLQTFSGGASSTQLSAIAKIYVGSTGTTTINGNLGTSVFSGGVAVSPGFGLDTSSAGTLSIATTTATAISVGRSGVTTTFAGPVNATSTVTIGSGTAVNSIVFGSCVISNSSPVGTSSLGNFNCTGATGVTTSHRVFLSATSSLPASLILQSASSTSAGVINVNILNASSTAAVAPGGISLNFYGIF